jgi:hypothetical protein
MVLLFGIAVFAIFIGLFGVFLGAAESAERRLRDFRLQGHEPWDPETAGGQDDQGIVRTPTR